MLCWERPWIRAARRAASLIVGGVLMLALGACSGPEASEGTITSEGVIVEGSPVPSGTVEDGADSSILQWLPDLLGSAAGLASEGAGRDDGYIRDGASISPFEADHPAIANLDPALRDALQRAAIDARSDGIEVRVTSGWRSAAYQQLLLDDAVSEYGSWEEARRYVSTPGESSHVTGSAVDIGPTDASYWMSRFGAAYGLCQAYANEIWHYELTIDPGGTCPAPLQDASSAAQAGRASTPSGSRPTLEAPRFPPR